jgi:tetratricopeptide (TPR) repeat protein
MKKYLFIIFSLATFFQLNAQTYQPEKINKKAIKYYDQALEYLQDNAFPESIPFLQKAITADTNYVDAILSLAGVYGFLKQHELSVFNYEWAKRKDTSYFKQFHLPYSINLAGVGKFKEALDAVNYFLAIPKISPNSTKSGNFRKRCYEFALQYQATHPITNYVFAPINLGNNVNSEKSEYYPAVTIDDSLLVFTRRGEGYREDFMQSRIQNNEYQKATVIKGDINIEPSKGAITVSADGEWMIFCWQFWQS